MTEQPTPVRDNNANRDMAIRTQALDMALRSNCGQYYDDTGRVVFDANKIVNGAKAFENFIKGSVEKAEIVSSKKEIW